MIAIILAAGEGSRLRPLTNTVPKPLIKIFGKSIINYSIESIYKYVSEIIIVVKYKEDLIKKEIGENYKGIKISYKTQGIENGTAAALFGIKSDEDILILNGDTIFNKIDLKKISTFNGYGMLVQEVNNPEKYGVLKIDEDGNIMSVIEKPKQYIGNLVNLGIYKFNSKILKYINKVDKTERGEYELTDAINLYTTLFPFKALPVEKKVIDITYPWDILTANKYFSNKLLKNKIDGIIEEGVTIKGNIVLEKGAILKSGTYIEGNIYIGKNTSIGPNTYLRGSTVIGENCKLGNAVEIKNSNIGNNTNVSHLSYIGDSIIGNNVNIAGGFISANLRHDKANIKVPIKGVLTSTNLYKFGVIIGDNCKTGINSSSMPGRVLENNTITTPGTIIK